MCKLLNILLVEDDAIEVLKFNRVIREMQASHLIMQANDGQQALDILVDRAVVPDIIVLDLNMPRLNGIEFLERIKQDEYRKNIPVIIFTTSSNYVEVRKCYAMGVAGYVLKPLKHKDYIDNAHALINYWSSNEFIH